MKEFFSKRWARVALAALIVIILIGASCLMLNSRSDMLSNGVNMASQPLRSALTSAAGWLENVYGYMYGYDSLKEENARLEARIEEMEAIVTESISNAEENERLRELLGFIDDHSDYVSTDCTIISETGSNWSSSFTLNKGSKAGIEVGDCVISSQGVLIGTVAEVGTTWSNVRTIIDSEFTIGAALAETGSSALAEGDFSLMQSDKLKLSYIPDGAEIVSGDNVITSGVSGLAPRGLLIGKVSSIEADASGLTHYAVIEPLARLSELSQVFVILDFEAED